MGEADIRARADEGCDSPDRAARCQDQRDLRARFLACVGCGARSGRSDREGRRPPADRHPDDGEGVLQRRLLADDLGLRSAKGFHSEGGCAGRCQGEVRRRRRIGQDQRSSRARRLAELQRDLRHDEQSVRPRTNPWRIVGWLGGGAPRRFGAAIAGSLRAPAHFCGVYAHKPTFALIPSRGHTPPPYPPLPLEPDLAVVGPMSRSASDLSDLLDVIAGPDEIEAGRGYRLALPAARHTDIKAFRILVLETHPLMPTAVSIRAAIEGLAELLAKSGAKLARESELMPDLIGSSRLYMHLLMSFLAAVFPPDVYDNMKLEAANLQPDDVSLEAEMLRGAVLSHRDWVNCDRMRAGLRAQWRALFRDFDAVICPIMPTSAYPHDHSPDQSG